jgi:hypothetical protein
MRADLNTKQADALLKMAQTQWEPWKAMSAAFAAGVAVATGLITLGGWLFGHMAIG